MTDSNGCAPKRRGGARGALAIFMALVPLLGCGEPEPEKPAVAEQVPAQPTPAPAVVEELKQGEAGTLPEGFPQDLPLYPGSSPSRWMAAAGPGSLVLFEADAEPALVFEHFESELPGAGWTIESKSAQANHWAVIASKDKRNARISIAASGSGSQFGIAVAEAD